LNDLSLYLFAFVCMVYVIKHDGFIQKKTLHIEEQLKWKYN